MKPAKPILAHREAGGGGGGLEARLGEGGLEGALFFGAILISTATV